MVKISLIVFVLYRVLPLGWNVILSFQAWSPLKPAQWMKAMLRNPAASGTIVTKHDNQST